MLKFLIVFAVILTAMGLGLPLLNANLPLWQVACGAFIPAVAISYVWRN